MVPIFTEVITQINIIAFNNIRKDLHKMLHIEQTSLLNNSAETSLPWL